MQDKTKIPEQTLNSLGEFTSTFALFYFDNDGTPCFTGNFPEIKDAMAISKLLEEYVNSNGRIFESEDGDDVPNN